MCSWTIEQSRQLYSMHGWSNGYFDINDKGHVMVTPNPEMPNSSIDLFELINEIKSTGIDTPVLARFTDILHDRIHCLHKAFEQARLSHNFTAAYTPVYPIKVNQEFSVVSEIANVKKHDIGLEAGSKTELMAVLALANQDNGIIVCNGYKDSEYIRLALIGQQLGHRVFLVIEKLSEIELIFKESANLNIEPLLGIRVRLTAVGSGKWQNTGGEKAKFGLSSVQTLDAIEQLQRIGALHTLKLLHFHLGSQITDIENVKTGMQECAAYFRDLNQLGAPIQYVDVGGGLSVDYEGTQSSRYFSMNYTMEDYADIIVGCLQQACLKYQIPQPNIISESGRAMTAHHAVLIVNVIDTDSSPSNSSIIPNSHGNILDELDNIYQSLSDPSHSATDYTALYHQSIQHLDHIQQRFATGEIPLNLKAAAELLFQSICKLLRDHISNHHITNKSTEQELYEILNQKLASKYFCNFSIFQSIPDAWAIDQIFPIMPLHQLNQQASTHVTLHDITCDSDGRIENYVVNNDIHPSIYLHDYKSEQPYYLGIFLVGAYQEILGDMHNLFGDTHSIDVQVNGSGHILQHKQPGDDVDYVLRHIHFDVDKIRETYQLKISNSHLPKDVADSYLTELSAALSGFTYLED